MTRGGRWKRSSRSAREEMYRSNRDMRESVSSQGRSARAERAWAGRCILEIATQDRDDTRWQMEVVIEVCAGRIKLSMKEISDEEKQEMDAADAAE